MKTNTSTDNLRKNLELIFIIFNMIILIFNSYMTYKNFEETKLQHASRKEYDKAFSNLDIIESHIIDLQNLKQVVDQYNVDSEQKDLDDLSESVMKVDNSIEIYLNRENIFYNVLIDEIDWQINYIEKKIATIRKIQSTSRNQPVITPPSTGYIPHLEEKFMNYKYEEMKLIKEKIKS